MKANKIAKNLLQDKTCDNCIFIMGDFCTIRHEQKRLPKENTCKRHTMRFSQRLNVKWSLMTQPIFRGVDVEEELIKTATNEIKRELKKNKWNKIKKQNDCY